MQTMTVKELIEALEKSTNKDKPVMTFNAVACEHLKIEEVKDKLGEFIIYLTD